MGCYRELQRRARLNSFLGHLPDAAAKTTLVEFLTECGNIFGENGYPSDSRYWNLPYSTICLYRNREKDAMPLHFWDFISCLLPISFGYVKCSYCRCWIATDVSSVCAHFREAYIDPCIVAAKHTSDGQAVLKSYIDRLPSSLVSQPEYATKIQESFCDPYNLAEDVIEIGKKSDQRVPDLIEKLPDLAALCEALLPVDRCMIECQRMICVKVAPFAADRYSTAEHFWEYHCPHLRKYNPSHKFLVIQPMWSILDKDRKSSLLVDDLIAIAQNGCSLLATTRSCRGENIRQGYHRFRKQRQWLVLQQLRGIFSDRHTRFLGFMIYWRFPGDSSYPRCFFLVKSTSSLRTLFLLSTMLISAVPKQLFGQLLTSSTCRARWQNL